MNDSYLCIDIGTNSIKALEKSFNGRVLKWGYLARKDKPFHTSIAPLDERDAVYYLKTLLAEMKISASEAVASLPAFLAFTAVADFPDPKYVPAAPGTFKLEYFRLSGGQFFLVAVPNDVLEKYGKIFSELGLKLLRVELESLALARTLGKVYQPTLIIDMGNRSTTFTIAQRGKVHFISHTDFAMASGTPDVIPHVTSSGKNLGKVARSYVRDVIMDKAKEIASEKEVKNIISSKIFSVANGL